jgi:type 1 glutamine amidotransferase
MANRLPPARAVVLVALAAVVGHFPAAAADPPALKALLITGGCCHDYKGQVEILTEGIKKRAHVEWTVVRGDDGREAKLPVYEKADWAKGYDVVVHNECYGSIADDAFVEGIARAHREGTPGVVIHCSMHSYRAAKTDEWRKCLGVTSRRHEAHRPVTVKPLEKDHPILAAFPDEWRTPNGELYIIEKTWPEMKPLATAWGEDTKKDHPVIWTNTYGKARIFGTTLGHHNETMAHEVYLDMIARGLLWAAGKLREDGEPEDGFAPGNGAPEGSGASK